MYVCMYQCMCVCLYVCVCTCVCMCICMYVCMNVCMYVYMYVCVSPCTHVSASWDRYAVHRARGHRVFMLCRETMNRVEWIIADLACILAGPFSGERTWRVLWTAGTTDRSWSCCEEELTQLVPTDKYPVFITRRQRTRGNGFRSQQ